MSQNDSGNVWRFFTGLFAGVVLTVLYVRFGVELPGIFGLEQKLISKAVVATAEIDLYNPQANELTRRRALAVVLANEPEIFLEVDAAIDNRFFDEFIRRKVARKSRQLAGEDAGMSRVMEHSNLAEVLKRKHRSNSIGEIKLNRLTERIREDKLMHGFLQQRYPDATDEVFAFLVKHPELTNQLRIGTVTIPVTDDSPPEVLR